MGTRTHKCGGAVAGDVFCNIIRTSPSPSTARYSSNDDCFHLSRPLYKTIGPADLLFQSLGAWDRVGRNGGASRQERIDVLPTESSAKSTGTASVSEGATSRASKASTESTTESTAAKSTLDMDRRHGARIAQQISTNDTHFYTLICCWSG